MITTPTHWPSPAGWIYFSISLADAIMAITNFGTLFQFVDFGDELTVTANRETSSITITPEIPGVATEDNLIWKAATALQQYTSTTFGADIQLKCFLWEVALAEALQMPQPCWSRSTIYGNSTCRWPVSWLALKLGANVPVFVRGHAPLLKVLVNSTAR